MISAILGFGNLLLSSANVIIGFSLFVYVLTYNRKSAVAQAFCALVAFVTLVHLVDVSIVEVHSSEAANLWLRLQWVGISFVPAAYLQFSDALLRTTGDTSRLRRGSVVLTYALGLASLLLVAFSDWIVGSVDLKEHIYHLVAGPGFWLFVLYYVATSVGGWVNIRRTRRRSVTSTSRRRLSYLMLAFLAPSVGVFPYLLIPTASAALPITVILLLNLLANLGLGLMILIIGYTVAYQGVFLPDRVVKHNLIHFLLRGPLVATLVVVIMLAVPRVEPILGLPRDSVLVVAVAGSVVILQLMINVAKGAIDLVIYRGARREISLIQSLDQRLLTTRDLEQLLENMLIAICDLLRSPAGFVVTMRDADPEIRVFCGPREPASRFLAHASIPSLLEDLSSSRRDEFVSAEDFRAVDGHMVLPLRGQRDEATLGILGIQSTSEPLQFGDEEMDTVYGLVHQTELALEDMHLQQQIFGLLQHMGRELDQIQRWRSTPLYVQGQDLQHFEANPIHSPGFVQMVKDALVQYWGGPKLSQSPLVRLKIVQEGMKQADNVPAKATRAVLTEAIERLEPDSERSLASSEWLVYNILELRFLQGQRIRDIAHQLAISESDYYRKQRIAIEQVSDILMQMERQLLRQSDPDR